MGTLTTTCVFQAVDSAEYAETIARLDAYEADPSNQPLNSREDDAQALRVTYVVVSEQSPN